MPLVDADPLAGLTQLLYEHRQLSHFGHCACGWRGATADHPRHQAHVLHRAGLSLPWLPPAGA